MEKTRWSIKAACALLGITVAVLSILLARTLKHLEEVEGACRGHTLPVDCQTKPEDLDACCCSATHSSDAAEALPNSHLDPFEIHFLVDRGLADPAGDLISDLVAHPEIIPMEAVLGGSMYFTEGSVVILSDRWAYAEFEDGHVSGSCLLEYEVHEGSVTWSVIAQ